jgi:uncharacterized alpha-E superfamily protein
MMLLSRVAESVYWAGRYLERAEATARLVKVHSELILDLPNSAGFGWSPLLAVTGTSEAFEERYQAPIEEDVIRFLTVDGNSHTSILSSVTSARYNFRLTRNVLPASAWEQLNQLFLWVVQSRTLSVDRRTRNGCMDRVIRDCQMLRGMLNGTMSHDEAYSFWEIGSLVERADMTTRVLDVQAGVLRAEVLRGDATHRSAAVETYSDLTWTTMLRSLSAQQMFRRTSKSEIATGPEALRFLLRDPQFPRSVEHCLTQISRSLLELPRYEAAMLCCAEVQRKLVDSAFAGLDAAGLHSYMDELQVAIGSVHGAIAETFFVNGAVVPSREASTALLATA